MGDRGRRSLGPRWPALAGRRPKVGSHFAQGKPIPLGCAMGGALAFRNSNSRRPPTAWQWRGAGADGAPLPEFACNILTGPKVSRLIFWKACGLPGGLACAAGQARKRFLRFTPTLLRAASA